MRKTLTEPEEELGLVFIVENDATRLSYYSRGDRVHGWLGPPTDGSTHALLIALSPSGEAVDPLVGQLARRCAGFARVVSIDLPLCGGRESDKLSAPAYRAGDPIAERVRPDLEEQLREDLVRLPLALEQLLERSPPCAVLALGPRALHLEAALRDLPAVVDPDPAPGERALAELERRVRLLLP